MRGHAAGLGANEADEIGLRDDTVRALARIGADDADGEWMRAGDRVLAVERSGNRDLQRLGERDELRPGAGCAHAAAGDDYRTLGLLQDIEGGGDMRRFRLRTERWHALEQILDHTLHLGLVEIELTFIAAELQMHGSR